MRNLISWPYDTVAFVAILVEAAVLTPLAYADEFHDDFAGSYVGTAHVPSIPVPISDILTFHADGTLTGTANDDFGFGDIATNGFNSPEHGVWRQTGPNEIATNSLSLNFDANGVLDSFTQVTSEAMISGDFQTISGSFMVNIFSPDQDPLIDTPVTSIPGRYLVQRLVAIPEPSAMALAVLVWAIALMGRRRRVHVL